MRLALLVLLVVLLTGCMAAPMPDNRLRTWHGEILQEPTDIAQPDTLFVVVFYWKPECKYCLEQMMIMQSFYKFAALQTDYAFIEIVGVYVGHSYELAEELMDQFSYGSIVGPEPRYVNGLPTTRVYAREGDGWHTVDTWIGVVKEKELWNAIVEWQGELIYYGNS